MQIKTSTPSLQVSGGYARGWAMPRYSDGSHGCSYPVKVRVDSWEAMFKDIAWVLQDGAGSVDFGPVTVYEPERD